MIPGQVLRSGRLDGGELREVIERLVAAGLGSIPGGGAEILVDRVRRSVSPAKATTDEWLEVMRTAHRLGLKTTATMMFGHIETPRERLAHLFLLRQLQDETGGFTACIPWPYQPGQDTLPAPPAGSTTYLRLLAISRLVLDNFRHIQASWVTQGPGQTIRSYHDQDLLATYQEPQGKGQVIRDPGIYERLKGDQAQLNRKYGQSKGKATRGLSSGSLFPQVALRPLAEYEQFAAGGVQWNN